MNENEKQTDFQQRVFLAALAGITANPNFFGPTLQQNPRGAVQFAIYCVDAAEDHAPAEWVGR